MPGNAIKNFFKRKRDQAKFMVRILLLVFPPTTSSHHPSYFFQTAGPGRKLNATEEEAARAAAASSSRRRPDDVYVPPSRSELTPEARAAADAALARVQSRADPRQFNNSLANIRMQVKRELEAERQAKAAEEDAAAAVKSTTSATAAAEAGMAAKENANLAVKGVFYR